mgnify:CR=1 FL=1
MPSSAIVRRQVAQVTPPLGTALPTAYKVAAILVCRNPHHATFQVSMLQITAPLLVCALVLCSIYTHAIFLVRDQHCYLGRHVLAVLTAFFLYFNGALALSSTNAGAAPFLSLLCALHLLHALQELLRLPPRTIYGVPNLLCNQHALANVLGAAKVAVLATSWFTLPVSTIDPEHLLYCIFTPEAAGMAIEFISHLI